MSNVSIELDETLEPILASKKRIQDIKTYYVKLYTSRSTVETGERCRRMRYLSTMLGGKGIASRAANFPLITGSMVHEAIATILTEHKTNGTVEKAFVEDTARDITPYKELLVSKGYFEDGTKLPGELEYFFNEQSSLFTALVYAWWLYEYPVLVDRFDVVEVEKEIGLFVPFGDGSFLCFESRADAILRVKGTEELVGYNLKTSKRWTDRNREAQKDGLQSITEAWALDRYVKWVNLNLEHTAEGLENIVGNAKAAAAVRNRKITGHVSGIRLCVLRKGDLERETGKVYNGLIRPYQRVSGPTGELEYAVEYQFPQPLNKSGYGRLGQGWERFNIWESDIGITQWLDKLMTGEIQPELGANPISGYVFSVPDYLPSKEQIKETIQDMLEGEIEWAGIKQRNNGKVVPELHEKNRAAVRMFRNSCHFPTDCGFYDVCFDSNVARDPLGNSDKFEERTPHHALEGEG